MARHHLTRIRECVHSLRYDLTTHAFEELAEDRLDIVDLEHVLSSGQIIRIEKNDPRGNRYVLEGTALDNATLVRVVGRFKENGRFLVITVYAIV